MSDGVIVVHVKYMDMFLKVICIINRQPVTELDYIFQGNETVVILLNVTEIMTEKPVCKVHPQLYYK